VEERSALHELYPDLPALLRAIRLRPGMFLGHKTIYGLHMLLCGIWFAEDFHELPTETRMRGFDSAGFERWVESRHNPGRLSHNSFSLAAHLAGADDAGFDLWFRWYDAFAGGSRGSTDLTEPRTAADRPRE
jgi:hypothetical protein